MPEQARRPGDLWQRMSEGDESAREELIRLNLGLVRSVARRFAGRGEPDDIEQIGTIGLIKAVDRFDPRLGLQFSTYAVPLIIGEIRRYFRDNGPMQVSRPLKELAARAKRLRDEALVETGREPTVSDLAEALGVGPDQIILALDSARPLHSLDEVIYESEGDAVTFGERVSSGAAEGLPMEEIALRDALRHLDEQLRRVILWRFFKDKTQAETASLIGVSQVQVSRLERRAIELIRRYLSTSA